jgi:hypothetical protein
MRKRLPRLACAIPRTVLFREEMVSGAKKWASQIGCGSVAQVPVQLPVSAVRACLPTARTAAGMPATRSQADRRLSWIAAAPTTRETRFAGMGGSQRNELKENGPDRGQGAASEETETVLPGNYTTSQPSVVEVTGVCGGDWAISRRSLERVIFPADKEFALGSTLHPISA